MKKVILENNFKKDYKLLLKRGKDPEKLQNIIQLLIENISLPTKCNPHRLKGEYSGMWECHIEGDWLLIYRYDENNIWLTRTGRHLDLFKKY